MSSKVSGSRFRDELSESLKALQGLGCWKHCFDNVGKQFHRCPRCSQVMHSTSSQRPADLMAIYRGHGVVIEAKETSEPRIDWDRLEPHQCRHLSAVHRAGGLALVAVRWCIPKAPRMFVVPYVEWTTMADKSGRKSLALLEGKRPGPPWLWEVFKARILTDPGLGIPNPLVWDLRPVLDHHLALHVERAGFLLQTGDLKEAA